MEISERKVFWIALLTSLVVALAIQMCFGFFYCTRFNSCNRSSDAWRKRPGGNAVSAEPGVVGGGGCRANAPDMITYADNGGFGPCGFGYCGGGGNPMLLAYAATMAGNYAPERLEKVQKDQLDLLEARLKRFGEAYQNGAITLDELLRAQYDRDAAQIDLWSQQLREGANEDYSASKALLKHLTRSAIFKLKKAWFDAGNYELEELEKSRLLVAQSRMELEKAANTLWNDPGWQEILDWFRKNYPDSSEPEQLKKLFEFEHSRKQLQKQMPSQLVIPGQKPLPLEPGPVILPVPGSPSASVAEPAKAAAPVKDAATK